MVTFRSQPIAGVVDWFNEDEGWGALSAPEVPGGCFVHFSHIRAEGYRSLRAGQSVRFTFRQPGFLQDGYPFSALEVWVEKLTASPTFRPRRPARRSR